MLKFSSDQIVDCLMSAKNPNAAIKNFLKKEVQGADALAAARFAKELRDIFATRHRATRENIKTFIEAHLPEYENHLLCIARYAHFDVVQLTAEQVTSKFAEDFNATYEVKDKEISISDPATFKKISKETIKAVDKAVKDSGRQGGDFLRNVMLASIFDREVLQHIMLEL